MVSIWSGNSSRAHACTCGVYILPLVWRSFFMAASVFNRSFCRQDPFLSTVGNADLKSSAALLKNSTAQSTSFCLNFGSHSIKPAIT